MLCARLPLRLQLRLHAVSHVKSGMLPVGGAPNLLNSPSIVMSPLDSSAHLIIWLSRRDPLYIPFDLLLGFSVRTMLHGFVFPTMQPLASEFKCQTVTVILRDMLPGPDIITQLVRLKNDYAHYPALRLCTILTCSCQFAARVADSPRSCYDWKARFRLLAIAEGSKLPNS